MAEKNPLQRSWFAEILSWVCVILVGFILAFLITSFVIIKTEVISGSMESTIMTGEHVLGNRLAYLFSDPERGEIILFQNPNNENEIYIKRIIGLPGEIVRIYDGQVHIIDTEGNEHTLDEPYLNEPMTRSYYESDVIPENCYFVMGDNRNISSDSRSWGFLERDLIYAKAWFIYWPFENFEKLDHPSYSPDED